MNKNAVWVEQLLNSSSVKFSPWEQENIALAAIAQCAAVVDNLATGEPVSQLELAACINPLLILNPSSFDEVYPNISNLSLGFRKVQELFGNPGPAKDSATIKYALSMIQLRSSLMNKQALQSTIRQQLASMPGLRASSGNKEEDSADSEENELIYRQLATLYQDTISTLSYRIQVHGKAEQLKDELIANKIRATLLAGIRAAVLWHQLGGRRWRLLIYRKRIHGAAGDIRRKLLHTVH